MKKISVVSAMIVAVCFLSPAAFATTSNVSMINFSFQPSTLTVNAGDTVTWTNNDGAYYGTVLHTTTSGTNCTPNGVWDSGSGGLLPGQSFSVIFNTPGTYPYFCRFHCASYNMVGTIIVTLPLPTSQQVFPPFSAVSPSLNAVASQEEPIGIGFVATGGNTFRIQIGLDQASGLMDVYFAVSGPALGPNIFLLTSSGTLQPISAGLVPWMSGLTGPVDMTLLPDTPTSILAPGTYTFYLAVTPHGSITSFYVWITSFTI